MTYRLSALAACLFLLCSQPAPGGLFTFREDGLAFIGFAGEQAGTSGELVKGGDPLNPDLTVLTFKLPFALPPAGTGGTAGDLLIDDVAGTSTVIGDLIRFLGNDTMVFYSDSEANDVGGDLSGNDADESGVDLNDRSKFKLQANTFSVLEVGREAVNDALYTPVEGQPGFDVTGPSYRFISDTPEPATLTLFGIGVLALLRRSRRQG